MGSLAEGGRGHAPGDGIRHLSLQAARASSTESCPGPHCSATHTSLPQDTASPARTGTGKHAKSSQLHNRKQALSTELVWSTEHIALGARVGPRARWPPAYTQTAVVAYCSLLPACSMEFLVCFLSTLTCLAGVTGRVLCCWEGAFVESEFLTTQSFSSSPTATAIETNTDA